MPKGLVVRGIYSIMKHPMYFGGIIFYIGIGMLSKSTAGLILTLIVIVPMLIYFAAKEEKLLSVKY